MAVFDCVPAKGVIGPGKPFQTMCDKSTAADMKKQQFFFNFVLKEFVLYGLN